MLASTDIYNAADQVMHVVQTSELNVAFTSVLNHSGFITSNPLFDKVTGQLHRTAKAMSDNVGSLHMALLAQAGLAHFDMGKYTRHTKCVSTKNRKGKSEKEAEEDTSAGSKLNNVLKHLQSTIEIPSLESLQPFIKAAFSSLDDDNFHLLQSFLHELYVLQPWTQPLSYKEDQELSKLDSFPVATQQVIGDDDDDDAEDWNDFAFSTILPDKSLVSCQNGKLHKITQQQFNTKTFHGSIGHSDKTQLDTSEQPHKRKRTQPKDTSNNITAMSTPINQKAGSTPSNKKGHTSSKKGNVIRLQFFQQSNTLTTFTLFRIISCKLLNTGPLSKTTDNAESETESEKYDDEEEESSPKRAHTLGTYISILFLSISTNIDTITYFFYKTCITIAVPSEEDTFLASNEVFNTNKQTKGSKNKNTKQGQGQQKKSKHQQKH